MTFDSEDPPAAARQEFCVALKAARERKGISLAEIASVTKIPAFLFAALERGDLRRWPKGLFRRSFFRDYVKTIGVPVAEACEEFARLFPDGGWPQPSYDNWGQPPTVAGDDRGQPPSVAARLEMDPAWHGPRSPMLPRLCAALIDAVIAVAVGVAVTWVKDIDLPTAIAIAGLTYFSLATALLGESPAKWIVSRRRSTFDALSAGREAVARVFAPAEPAEEPETRPWYSDAHRVGTPRLRVRIKMPH